MTKAPWDYTPEPQPGVALVLNQPTPEGMEMGEHLARFVYLEREKHADLPATCDDCAFRKGTRPNGCPPTLMDALKCIIEGEPFYCHHRPEQPLCAGFLALSRATPRDGA